MTTINMRSTPTPTAASGRASTWRRGLVPALMVASVAVAGCSSLPSISRDDDEIDDTSLAAAALNAARYSQPSVFADAVESDAALADISHLLAGDDALGSAFVEGDEWCSLQSSSCVEVGGNDDELEFGGISIDEFILDADAEVSEGVDLEVVAVHALHHPVRDTLVMSLDLRSTSQTWADDVQPTFEIDGDAFDAFLDGPSTLRPGVITRYLLVAVDDPPLDGTAELTAIFSNGVFEGEVAEVTVRVRQAGPPVERRQLGIDATAPIELYRSTAELSADPVADGPLVDLIETLVAGDDVSSLVAEDSPAAIAAAAISEVGRGGEIRRDPDDPAAVCWQLRSRRFCERWRVPVENDGQISSWEIEGVSIVDLVVARSGSRPQTELAMLRLPLGRVVVGNATVRNEAASVLDISLYRPTVVIDGLASLPFVSDGEFSIESGETEQGWFAVDADDLDFDVDYDVGYDIATAPLRFPADAGAPGTNVEGEANQSAAILLASLLVEERYTEAAELAAIGSGAEHFLSSVETLVSEAFLFLSPDAGSLAGVCVDAASGEVCSEIVVDALDADGLITALTVGGSNVDDLVVVDRAGGDELIQLSVDRAVQWPGVVTVVSWSLTNSTESPLFVTDVAVVDETGTQTPADRSPFEEVLASRTVTLSSEFDGDVLDQAFEVRGEGDLDAAVQAFSSIVFLGEEFVGLESSVTFADATTTFETRGGRSITIPGDWRDLVYFDDETNELVGAGTTLGPPKAQGRSDLRLLVFSPLVSPFDVTTDDLIAALGEFAVIRVTEISPVSAPDGRETAVFGGEIDIIDETSFFLAIPSQDELFVVVVPAAGPEDSDAYFDLLLALGDIARIADL